MDHEEGVDHGDWEGPESYGEVTSPGSGGGGRREL